MGTKIRDIIDYYADHDVSDEIKEGEGVWHTR